MKALTFLLKRTIINYFLNLKKKPQKIIGPVFIVFWFVMMFIQSGSRNSSASKMGFETFVTIFIAIISLLFLFSLYSGTKKIDSLFTLGDVNFIFTSPIKPQTVLVYGLLKKVALELLTSIYILYQVPNTMRNLHVPVINQIVMLLVFVLFQFIFSNVLKLFIFALNTKYPKLGSIIRTIIKAMGIGAVVGVVYLFLRGNILGSLSEIANTVVYSKWFGHIPVIGWLREIIVQVIKGMNLSLVFFVAIYILLSILMLYITYNIKLDYYEDMLSGAETYTASKNTKMTKEASVNVANNPFHKPIRKRLMKLGNAYGAKVLFFKHINEYVKRSFVFFINTFSIALFVLSIVLGLFVKGLDIKVLLLIACGMLFFTAGMGSKIYNEIYHYFIFLLPDSPHRKLFYGMAASLVKAGSDALLLFVPFGILAKISIFEVILAIISYMLLAGMLSYSGLFAFRIADFFGFDSLIGMGLLFMFFQMLLAVPLVILVSITTIGFKALAGYTVFLSIALYSIGMGVIFSFGNAGMFDNTEF